MLRYVKNKVYALLGPPSFPDWEDIYKEWRKWPVRFNDSSKKKNKFSQYVAFILNSLLYAATCTILTGPVIFIFLYGAIKNSTELSLLHLLFSIVSVSPYFIFQKIRWGLKNSLILALFLSQIFIYHLMLHPISKALFETPGSILFSPHFFSFSNYGQDKVCKRNGEREGLHFLSLHFGDGAEICSTPLQDDLKKMFPEGTKKETVLYFMEKYGASIQDSKEEKGCVEYDYYGFGFMHYSIFACYDETNDSLLSLNASSFSY